MLNTASIAQTDTDSSNQRDCVYLQKSIDYLVAIFTSIWHQTLVRGSSYELTSVPGPSRGIDRRHTDTHPATIAQYHRCDLSDHHWTVWPLWWGYSPALATLFS